MKRTLFLIATLAFVIAALAGGTAFMLRQRQLNELQRLATQAEDMMQSRRYQEALPLLRKVETRGGTARSAFLLGKIYYEQEKYDEALTWLQQVLDKYPRSELVPEALLYKARYALDVKKDKAAAQALLIEIVQKYGRSSANDFALVELAGIALSQGNEALAKKSLEQVMRKQNSPARSAAEFLMGDINMRELKSPTPGPEDEIYTIKRGDSLYALERRLKVPSSLLVAINNVDPRSLSVGTQLKIPRVEFSVVIDKQERTLTLRNRGAFLKKYRVGIPREDARLPADSYQVSKKYDKGYDFTDPSTNQVVKAGDPNNPYGDRFIELRRGMGIHGTNQPELVGTYTPRGFVTMTNQDVEELYGLVQDKPGTTVVVKGRVQPEASPGKR